VVVGVHQGEGGEVAEVVEAGSKSSFC
jgi:hypothetical protein